MIGLLLLIALTWITFFFTTLHVISQLISHIGVYHKLGNGENTTEKFRYKFLRICYYNGLLSFPLIFSINIVIQTTLDKVDANIAFYLSLPITLTSLIAIRLLANPSELLRPSLCRFYDALKQDELVDLHKERIISFFYSFICAAIVLLLIILSYHIFMNRPLDELKIPGLSCVEFAQALIIYIISLSISTLIGEVILKYIPPIRDIPCNNQTH